MRKKYDDETLEKVFYYYSLAENRMLTAAQAADCLNLSESSLFRVIADFRENISREKEEEIIQKYQKVDVNSALNIKENPKNYSTEKSILEDIAITLAEILASVNEIKQYIKEKEGKKHNYKQNEKTKLEELEELEEIDNTSWEEIENLEELITKTESKMTENNIENKIQKTKTEPMIKQHETIWKGESEPTLEELEKGLVNLQENPNSFNKLQKQTKVEPVKQEIKKQSKPVKKESNLDSVAMICVAQLNYMCKEIDDLVSYGSMEKMWNDWEKICRGYGSRINPIYQRVWNQMNKKVGKGEITEHTIKVICDAQVEQMELELKEVSSQDKVKNISYTYYNWVRQVFEMCYLMQAPMSQDRTKILYTTYLTKLKNISSHKMELMQ